MVPGERLTITGNILTIVVAEVWVFEERVSPYILQWTVQPPPTKLYDFTHINRTLFRPQRSQVGKEKGEAHKEREREELKIKTLGDLRGE